MKRFLIIVFLSISLIIVLAGTAIAAQTISLYIDDKQVPTEPNICSGINGKESNGTYYMDVQPQLRDGRTYVPIQVVSKFLGANITWQNPNVLIGYGDTSLTLTLGSKTAVKNDTELTLDAAPYAKNGRTMVPIRFIAEAFGCKVGYANTKVYVGTEPLVIDGKKIKSVQKRIRMTMGWYYQRM